jgi:hypothetical protein
VVGPSHGIWPARTRGRGAEEKLGQEGADRRAPSVSDGGTVIGWQAGSHAKMGQSQCRAGPATEKAAHDDFSNLNPFSK